MGDMKFLLFTALGISLLMFSGAFYISELEVKYNLSDTRSINGTRWTDPIINTSTKMSSNLQASQQTGTPTDDPIQTFIKGSYGAIILFFDFINLYANLADYLVALIPEMGLGDIAPILIGLGVAGIILTVAIIMFNAIFKTQG